LNKKFWTISVFLYSAFILYATLYPFNIQHFRLDTLQIDIASIFNQNYHHFSKSNFLTNFLLFVLLGFFCCGFFSSFKSKILLVLGFTLSCAYGFALSVAIETIQIYIPSRVSSFEDIKVDSFAAAVGFIIFAFIYESGLAGYIKNKYNFLAKNNPSVLLWILTSMIIILLGLFPFDFDLSPHNIKEQIRNFDTRSIFSHGGITFKFFYSGVIYFVWGIISVFPASREDRPFLLSVLINAGISCFLIVCIEFAQFFFPSHIPSRADIETNIIWYIFGVVLCIPFVADRNIDYAVFKRKKDSHSLSTFFWVCFVGTITVIILSGLYPFSFDTNTVLLKSRIQGIELAPFGTYIRNFNILTLDDFFTKSLFYFILGFELAYAIKKYFPRIRFIPLLTSVFIISLSTAIETVQILIPQRHPSLTDIIIAFAFGLFGATIMPLLITTGSGDRNE